MGGLEVTHSDSVRRIVGVKLTDQHRLETTHKECGTTSLESMVLDCSLARSAAEDAHVEQLDLRKGHRNITDFPGMYSVLCNPWGP
eukprot:363218-Chlamydomonas_euryale.AAC.3